MNILPLEILISAIIFIISLGLGFTIYIKNPGSSTNRLFFLLSFLIDIYIIINYLSLHPPSQTLESQLFWIRMVMVITSFMAPTTLLLVHTFPGERITLKLRYIMAIGFLTLASASLSATSLIFKSLEFSGTSPIPVPGPAIPVFFLDFVGLFLVSFGILVFRYRHQHQVSEEKKIYLLVLLGVVISFSLTSFFTVILVVIFKISNFVLFGPLSPVILMAFIAYAIVKHGLFDVKVIAVEMFTVLISIIVFSKILVAESLQKSFVDMFVFFMIVIFGILLIRSVRKEVEQRKWVQNLALELSTANEKLKKLDQAKSEFISIASHQLRTPLTVIKGYLSLALEGTLGPITAQTKESLGKAAFSTEQLVKLINELLDLSRIESGKITYVFATNDLTKIIDDVVGELTPQANAKHLTLKKETERGMPQFIFDRDKIREIVINLLHNAIKYTAKGQILIRAEIITKSPRNMVRLSIKDSGMGIAKKDIQKVFTKFGRTEDARLVDPSGMGIGLYFVKKVAEDHGGTAWAESEGPGKGSTFIAEIPFKQ